MPEKQTDDLFSEEEKTGSVLPFDALQDPDDEEEDVWESEEADETEDECKESETLMNGLLAGTEAASHIAPQNIISVAVGYAMKRGKIKKRIKKTLRKLAARYHLNIEPENEVTVYMAEACKPFLREVRHRYGENASQALEYAYFGAVLACLLRKDRDTSLPEEAERLFDAFESFTGPEAVHKKVSDIKKDGKDKLARPLTDYAERVNVYAVWDNIDESMKKKSTAR